jgi:phosphoribosylamine--glycine ligase
MCAPGNAGIAATARCLPTDGSVDGLAALAETERVDLTVVGPEAPLAAGLVDELERRGLPAFGPSRVAARLESSKAHAKRFMRDHGIPTAAFAVFDALAPALAHLEQVGVPVVVKASGLAAGKGVTVARNAEEATLALRSALGWGAEVVVEEFLEGPELSVMALCDGTTALLMPPARDHKRLLDGDRGPMTGGMGAVCPVPLEPGLLEAIRTRVVEPCSRR